MGPPKSKKSTKSPPILSHEFVIKNYADIVSCTAMIFVVGLMVQKTAPFCSAFVAMQYNIETDAPTYPVLYSNGLKDICSVFFYFLMCIVIHAVIQEYILDKVNKKLHLSKIKNSQFNESGQLLAFYAISVLWALDIILNNNLLSVAPIWADYPQQMTFMTKFFLIIQISYWIQWYPQLYLQKVKKEEILSKIKTPSVILFFIISAYVMNYSKIAVLLTFVHYFAEAAFHIARIYDFVNKNEERSKAVYAFAHILFLGARVVSILLTILTFLYGFSGGKEDISVGEGYYNVFFIRIAAIALTCGIQGYLLFISKSTIFDQLKEFKINIPSIKLLNSGAKKEAGKGKKRVNERLKKPKDNKTASDNELTEVDQSMKKALKGKRTKAK